MVVHVDAYNGVFCDGSVLCEGVLFSAIAFCFKFCDGVMCSVMALCVLW